MLYCAESVNTGAHLWWQQYRGLLLKRVLDTVRFWQGLAAIYIIPVMLCLVGLLLFRYLNGLIPPDPTRELRVDNSGLDPDHQILFWAQIGEHSNIFDFEVCAQK